MVVRSPLRTWSARVLTLAAVAAAFGVGRGSAAHQLDAAALGVLAGYLVAASAASGALLILVVLALRAVLRTPPGRALCGWLGFRAPGTPAAAVDPVLGRDVVTVMPASETPTPTATQTPDPVAAPLSLALPATLRAPSVPTTTTPLPTQRSGRHRRADVVGA